MKKLLIIFTFMLGVSQANAQFEEGDVLVSLVGLQDFHSNISGGVEVQYFVHEHISLNYRITYSPGHVHMPGGIPATALMLVSSLDWILDPSMFYLALLPEGVSFYITLSDNISIAPYINPAGYDYVSTNRSSNFLYHETSQEHFLTFTGGARLSVFMGDRLVVSPFSEYMTSYNNDIYGMRFGISVGMIVN